MITRFNNRTVVIRRLRSSAKGKNYVATATADTNIQNIEDENFASKEGIAQKTYKAYFDVEQNIQVNDILTDEMGRRFRVMGVEKLGDNLGISVDHLEVILHRYEG